MKLVDDLFVVACNISAYGSSYGIMVLISEKKGDNFFFQFFFLKCFLKNSIFFSKVPTRVHKMCKSVVRLSKALKT